MCIMATKQPEDGLEADRCQEGSRWSQQRTTACWSSFDPGQLRQSSFKQFRAVNMK
jgi:hypothetical protein